MLDLWISHVWLSHLTVSAVMLLDLLASELHVDESTRFMGEIGRQKFRIWNSIQISSMFHYSLNPAGPLFDVNNPAQRLDSTDGEYVEVIHTETTSFGIGAPIGHANFYINGGFNQPGCTRKYFLFNICKKNLWVHREFQFFHVLTVDHSNYTLNHSNRIAYGADSAPTWMRWNETLVQLLAVTAWVVNLPTIASTWEESSHLTQPGRRRLAWDHSKRLVYELIKFFRHRRIMIFSFFLSTKR